MHCNIALCIHVLESHLTAFEESACKISTNDKLAFAMTHRYVV